MQRPSSPPEFTDADERILRHLREAGADYPALVSGNTGLHAPLVERRLALLEAEAYVEAVTGESIYRITDAGEVALDVLDAPDPWARARSDAGAPARGASAGEEPAMDAE